MEKDFKKKPPIQSGWQRFRRTVLHRPDSSDTVSPEIVPVTATVSGAVPDRAESLSNPATTPSPIRRRRRSISTPADVLTAGTPSQTPVDEGSIKVSADVHACLEAYCSTHQTTREQLFHCVFNYSKLSELAAEIGVADGVLELLIKEHGGVLIGADPFQKVVAYCQTHGLTMEQLFSEHDTRRTAFMAREVGIQPPTFLHLVKFFRGSLAAEGAPV